jgi:antitoxin VapB
MAFNIKDPEADRLVRELAGRTGETLTEAIVVAVRERLGRIGAGRTSSLAQEIGRIATRCGKRPVRDARSPDVILGYDEAGLPH